MITVEKLIKELQKFKPTDEVSLCKRDCGVDHIIIQRNEDEQFMEFVDL
jgi:hypothetical protein